MPPEPIQSRVSKLLGVYTRRSPTDTDDRKLLLWALKQLQQTSVALQVLLLGAQDQSTVDAPWVEEIAERGLKDVEDVT